MSLGTRCTQYLFLLSLNPPEASRLPEAAFEEAVDRIEQSLGLAGQPRAIVLHEKDGWRHAHCVWSRIDADTLTTRPMPFFKNPPRGARREISVAKTNDDRGTAKYTDGFTDSQPAATLRADARTLRPAFRRRLRIAIALPT